MIRNKHCCRCDRQRSDTGQEIMSGQPWVRCQSQSHCLAICSAEEMRFLLCDQAVLLCTESLVEFGEERKVLQGCPVLVWTGMAQEARRLDFRACGTQGTLCGKLGL